MAMDPDLIDELNQTCMEILGDSGILIDGVEVDAVFHDAYNELGLGVGMESSSPYLELLSNEASSVNSSTSITVSGVSYRAVMPLEPDGTGMTIVRLDLI
ncbi:hypothetical protein [Methylophaga sp.]|uniref:head-tail joining protein n=1 Tax=Methylophaga sp. TaxID=2024840 RepID=UPI003A92797A